MKKFMFLILSLWLCSQVAWSVEVSLVWRQSFHEVSKVQFSKDDSRILVTSEWGSRIFNTMNGDTIITLPDGDARFSGDGTIIYGVQTNYGERGKIISHSVNIYNANTYELIKKYDYPELVDIDTRDVDIRLSNDYKTIVLVIDEDSYLMFIDYNTGAIKKTLKSKYPDYRIYNAEFTQDSKYFIASNFNARTQFINTETFEVEYTLNLLSEGFKISDNSKFIALIGGYETNIATSIMDLETKKVLHTISGNPSQDNVRGLAFSPDNSLFAIKLSGRTSIYNLKDFSIYLNPSLLVGDDMDINTKNDLLVSVGGNSISLYRIGTTPVIEDKQNDIIMIYPNPSTGLAFIEYNQTYPEITNISVLNENGEKLQEVMNKFIDTGLQRIDINTSNLPSGFYLLQINNSHQSITFKLIIEK